MAVCIMNKLPGFDNHFYTRIKVSFCSIFHALFYVFSHIEIKLVEKEHVQKT